jgi:hypothetical protein
LKVEGSVSVGRFGCLLLLWLAMPTALYAHQLDEYLQATLVEIGPEGIRLQMNLTPGVAVATKVIALVDRDGDGVISTNEAAAYLELLTRDLSVRLDGRDLELRARRSYFPQIAELRTGCAFIQIEYSGKTGALKPGLHQLTITNGHLPAISAYLVNAMRPGSSDLQIIRQNRTENQSASEIEFSIGELASSANSQQSRDR